jgi:cell division protein FtsI/penicillin-binding protein 2
VRPGLGRLSVLLLGFAVFVVLLVGRLASLQLVKHDYYWNIYINQVRYFKPIPAKRGTIFDRRLRPLARSLPAYRVHADPYLIGNPEAVAAALDKIVSLDPRHLVRTIKARQSHYVPIAVALDVERALQIKRLDLDGVYVEAVGKRARPLADVAGNVIGCLSPFEEPLSGIELKFDEDLRGEPGLQRCFRDALGNPVPCIEDVVEMPVSGNSLVLTLDADLQTIAERALDHAVEEHHARGGCAVMVDPWSGDILALVSNPRNQNLPVTAVFEPGSSLKLCTFATALDLGRVTAASMFDTGGGKLKIPGGWITDEHPRQHPLTLIEAFTISSNVASSMIARKIGADDFYRYLCAFGFGSRTGIELEGESKGILREPDQWSRRSLETLAIGQEIGVTALQLAMAYAAVANGGQLLEPRLVKAIIDQSGSVKKSYPAKTVRRVIRAETASDMRGLLESVVQGGTGTLAGLQEFHVAGKTGTGQKAERGGYVPGKYYSVFAGFVPAESPRYVCVVLIDEPQGGRHYGGTVCGPVFKEIMDLVLKIDKEPIPQTCVRLTRSKGSLRPALDAIASSAGLPLAGDGPAQDVCPTLTGLTLREAARVLEGAEIGWTASGSGVVIRQVPPPQAPLDDSRQCHLILDEVP